MVLSGKVGFSPPCLGYLLYRALADFRLIVIQMIDIP